MDARAEEKLGFGAGFAHVFIGLRFAYAEHRELAAFFLPPMVVGILLLITGFTVFSNLADDLVSLVWSAPENAFLHVLWSFVSFIVWAVCAAITAVAVAVITMIVAAPFSDIMSERVEGILGTWSPRPFSARFLLRDIGHTVALELRRALVKLAWLLPLFIVSLVVPVVGQLAYVGIGGYLLAKFLGMDYVDWCLARRGYSWRERFEFAKRHRAALVGFGAAMTLALLLPFGFVVVWPGAVAGGTILCTRLGPEDKRAPSTIERRGDA